MLKSEVNLDIWYLNNYCLGGERIEERLELGLVKKQQNVHFGHNETYYLYRHGGPCFVLFL